MTSYRLALDYSLPAGWLAPYLDGLREGRAMGWACASGGTVSFPPLRAGSGGPADGAWVRLSGRATILARTSGSDGDFALAAFEGAKGAATVRLVDLPEAASEGTLLPGTGPMPQLCLGPLREGQDR